MSHNWVENSDTTPLLSYKNMSENQGLGINEKSTTVQYSGADGFASAGGCGLENESFIESDVSYSGNLSSYFYNVAQGPDGGGVQMKKLSTFMGVFVPCVLSIFGVILFVRLPWIVGQAGLVETLIMLALAFLVVTITVLSLSAICGNGRMKGGGCYFLISRALGPEFGGAVGVIFYSANVMGCAVYLVGFAEAFLSAVPSIPDERVYFGLVCGIPLILLTIICVVGAQAFAKTSFLVFVLMNFAIWFCVGSFLFQPVSAVDMEGFTSWDLKTIRDNISSNYTLDDIAEEKYTFFRVFAILFPAATGIMAGANMSGDLKSPAHDIPVGTLGALLYTGIAYMFFAIVIAFTVEGSRLVCTDTISCVGLNPEWSGYFAIQYVAYTPIVFHTGIFCATLSSAMATIIGGAKILQALARDELLPFLAFFKKGSKVQDEPRRAVIFTGFLVGIILAISDSLNILATYQTLFFLLSYGVVNIACFLLAITGSPNFRPTFRYYTWYTSLFGAILCIGMMFLSEAVGTGISVFLAIILLLYIHHQGPVVSWGDLSQAIIYHQVRKYLLRLDIRKHHIKFWRPQILLLVNNPRSCYRRIQFANKLKKGGLLIIGSVTKTNVDKFGAGTEELIARKNRAWVDYIFETKLKAFSDVILAKSIRRGVQNALMTSGLGAMKPNSVMLGFYEEDNPPQNSIDTLRHLSPEAEINILDALHMFPDIDENPCLRADEYVRILKDILAFGKNLYVTRNLDKLPYYLIDENKPDRKKVKAYAKPRHHTIDVWMLPMFDKVSMNMCMFLSFILSKTINWKKWSKLRVLSIIRDDISQAHELQQLKAAVEVYRLPCTNFEVFCMEDFMDEAKEEEIQSARGRFWIINKIIKSAHGHPAMSFLPLPSPPLGDRREACYEYMTDIDILSRDLGPTVLVHGNNVTVMTTEV